MADTLIVPNTGSLSVTGLTPRLNFNMLSSVSKTPGTGVLTITGKSLTVTMALVGAFVWRPSTAKLRKKPKVDQMAFGDGYEQRQAVGINNNLQTWDLTFAGLPQYDGDNIEAYLDQMGAVSYFQWLPPNRTTSSRFVCDEYDREYDPERDGTSTITATFREVLG